MQSEDLSNSCPQSGHTVLCFFNPQPNISFYCEIMDIGIVHHACLCSSFSWYSLHVPTER